MPSTYKKKFTEDSDNFNIEFDYRFDEFGLFTEERKAVLEYAADIWSSYIQDEFSAIQRNETAYINLNGTFEEVKIRNPIDDLLIFVSFTDIDEIDTLGHAKYIFGEYETDTNAGEERIYGEDYQPWIGHIEFNTAFLDEFYFDQTPETADDLPVDKQDFLTLSLHEIGHVLGIGASESFYNQVEEGKFIGQNSVDLNGGDPIPLNSLSNHSEEGFNVDSEEDALLSPLIDYGERKLPSALDLAMLADIGYEITQIEDEVELADEEIVELPQLDELVHENSNVISVHRFFQYERGFHFYTADRTEGSNVIQLTAEGVLQYNYEGISYDVLASDVDNLTGSKIAGALPVYRFFNNDTGAHLYTINEDEKNFILESLDNYNFEGAAYYAFADKPETIETVPLYRMLNTQSGSHLFTTNSNEFNDVQDMFSHFQPEGNAGVTFYVLS